MKFNLFLICLIGIIIASCGVPESEYNKLKTENQRLKSELDECKFGADRIIASVDKAYSEKNYTLAKELINKLYEKHPESPKNLEFKKLLKKIEKLELAEKQKKEAVEKERIRLANLNNTGMWRVSHYVDDFGEPTKEGYICNSKLIRGAFSNTATQNSPLDVKLLISSSSDISIKLYEYAGNNPVKAYSSVSYNVLIQDNDGKRYRLKATNYSDRLSFNRDNSAKVHKVLLKGGEIKFKIVEVDNSTTEYGFTIKNAQYFDNANRKLNES